MTSVAQTGICAYIHRLPLRRSTNVSSFARRRSLVLLTFGLIFHSRFPNGMFVVGRTHCKVARCWKQVEHGQPRWNNRELEPSKVTRRQTLHRINPELGQCDRYSRQKSEALVDSSAHAPGLSKRSSARGDGRRVRKVGITRCAWWGAYGLTAVVSVLAVSPVRTSTRERRAEGAATEKASRV